MFTWIPIHREAIHRILEHRQNQKELLTILREMEQQALKVINLQDEGADGKPIPLAEIDPFSFLATFNRGVTEKNRRDNRAFLKARWGLTRELMLLYPTVDSPLSADYSHKGHKIRIRTINLDQPWQDKVISYQQSIPDSTPKSSASTQSGHR